MADLIEKYFREDLTEAEEARLSEQLAASDEAAARFGEKAEEAYRGYGLPDPGLPGHGSTGVGMGKVILLAAAACGLIGTAGWVCYRTVQCRASDNESGVSSTVAAPTQDQPGSVSEEPASAVEQPVPASERRPTAQKKISVVRKPEAAIPALAPPPLVPSDRATPPAKGKGLQVLLPMTADGHASVRVLDASGREIYRLFDGTLKTGKWTLYWDGKIDGGKPVAEGLYQIEVDMNGTVRSREVRIR